MQVNPEITDTNVKDIIEMLAVQGEDLHQQIVQLVDPDNSIEGEDTIQLMRKFLERQKVVFEHAMEVTITKTELKEKVEVLVEES